MTGSGSQRLKRCDRLRERRDYQRVSQKGIRVNSRFFVMLAAPRWAGGQTSSPRLGITASRRVGPAVVRSLMKRRIREWFRCHREDLPVSKDIVVIARPGVANASRLAIEGELTASAKELKALVAKSSGPSRS